MSYKAPKGTNDVLPGQSHAWRSLENEFAALASLYGYQEIRTPAFEETELFTRSSGETSEIVTKQMYTFLDKKGRSLTLKPEGTAPAVRAFLEHQLGQQGSPTRLWYQTQIFRYEQPQFLRYRQAHQLGLELFGSLSPEADAEIIEVTCRFFEQIGIPSLCVRLNSIGRVATRARYGEEIARYAAAWLSDQDEETRARVSRNPLRLLDSKDPAAKQALSGVAPITGFLEEESQTHFDAVRRALDRLQIPYEVDPMIVRGLDYYNDTVFEVQSSALGAQNSVCGGGRYDGLVRGLGGPDVAAVGVGIGVERALYVQSQVGHAPNKPRLDVFVVSATESARDAAIALASELRRAGVSASFDLDHRVLKSQLKQADRARARRAAIIGDDELAANTVTVRDLDTGEQKAVPRADAINALR
jgi:histidyl-tRNA synthetase